MFIFFSQCAAFQLILMEVKCAESKENCNTHLEASKDKQGVSNLFSTKHVFMLISWLQEKKIPFQGSHTVKQLNHSITY